jgi:hypothetical protein
MTLAMSINTTAIQMGGDEQLQGGNDVTKQHSRRLECNIDMLEYLVSSSTTPEPTITSPLRRNPAGLQVKT